MIVYIYIPKSAFLETELNVHARPLYITLDVVSLTCPIKVNSQCN